MKKCERCGAKPEGYNLLDYCEGCGKDLCAKCMREGCCGQVPARSGMSADDEEDDGNFDDLSKINE